MRRLAVIGIGNPMRGDDGIGPAVIEALRGRVPPGVVLLTLSGETTELADALASLDAAVVVDCALGRGADGTIRRFAHPGDRLPPDAAVASSHAGGLQLAFRLLMALGRMPRRVVVLTALGSNFAMGAPISATVEAAVWRLARCAQEEIAGFAEVVLDA